METASEEEKAAVFQEIESSASQLMSDLFGNYVVQKFFEFGNSQQMEVLLQSLEGNVVTLSFQTYGCRVVQRALENLPSEQQVIWNCVLSLISWWAIYCIAGYFRVVYI